MSEVTNNARVTGPVALPPTGGGGLGLIAALLCATGWACLKTAKAPSGGETGRG